MPLPSLSMVDIFLTHQLCIFITTIACPSITGESPLWQSRGNVASLRTLDVLLSAVSDASVVCVITLQATIELYRDG
jgi:hypothetical protein